MYFSRSEEDEEPIKPESKKESTAAPVLFEDLERKSEHDQHEADTKIEDAVDDLFNELEGQFKDKDESGSTKDTSIDVKDGEKDAEKAEGEPEKEIRRLVDEWDDDL